MRKEALPPTLRRLLLRELLLVVVAACLIYGVYVGLDVLSRHEYLSPNPIFGGWQTYLTVSGIGVVTVAVAVGCLVIRRRHPALDRPTWAFRGIAGFIALLVGIAPLPVLADSTDRLLTWTSDQTSTGQAASARFRAELARVVGDAAHRPVLRNFGESAPARAAARMVKPKDLGPEWGYAGIPPVTITRPTPSPGYPAATSRIRTFLTAEHWTGGRWEIDQDLIETATRYTSSADARRAIRATLHATMACNLPSPCSSANPRYQRRMIGGMRVWVRPQATSDAVDAIAVDRDVVLTVRLFPPLGDSTVRVTGNRLLRIAIGRLKGL